MSKLNAIDFIDAARAMVGPSLSIAYAIERRRISATINRLPHQSKRERERRMKRMAKGVKS